MEKKVYWIYILSQCKATNTRILIDGWERCTNKMLHCSYIEDDDILGGNLIKQFCLSNLVFCNNNCIFLEISQLNILVNTVGICFRNVRDFLSVFPL